MTETQVYSRPDSEQPLEYQIEYVYMRLLELKRRIQANQRAIETAEENAKMEHIDEWTAAKNSDQRHAVLLGALANDADYHESRGDLRNNQDLYELYDLEVKRIKLLLDARKLKTAD